MRSADVRPIAELIEDGHGHLQQFGDLTISPPSSSGHGTAARYTESSAGSNAARVARTGGGSITDPALRSLRGRAASVGSKLFDAATGEVVASRSKVGFVGGALAYWLVRDEPDPTHTFVEYRAGELIECARGQRDIADAQENGSRHGEPAEPEVLNLGKTPRKQESIAGPPPEGFVVIGPNSQAA